MSKHMMENDEKLKTPTADNNVEGSKQETKKKPPKMGTYTSIVCFKCILDIYMYGYREQQKYGKC